MWAFYSFYRYFINKTLRQRKATSWQNQWCSTRLRLSWMRRKVGEVLMFFKFHRSIKAGSHGERKDQKFASFVTEIDVTSVPSNLRQLPFLQKKIEDRHSKRKSKRFGEREFLKLHLTQFFKAFFTLRDSSLSFLVWSLILLTRQTRVWHLCQNF